MPGGLPLIKTDEYMASVLGNDFYDIHKNYYFGKLNLLLPRTRASFSSS